jgi:hypothetical protein
LIVQKFNEDSKNKSQRILLGGNIVLNSTSFLDEVEKFVNYKKEKVVEEEIDLENFA